MATPTFALAIRVQPVPAVSAPIWSKSQTAVKPHALVACAVYDWAIDDADVDPDLPCARNGVVVSAPVSTRTLTADIRSPDADPDVTVTVIAADVDTGAVHAAAWPCAVGASAIDCQSVRVYVSGVPRLSVIDGADGVAS